MSVQFPTSGGPTLFVWRQSILTDFSLQPFFRSFQSSSLTPNNGVTRTYAMTSQYVTEPPSSGLVDLVTSKGTISIALFPTQAPLACRNFLTLALEGFYDNLVFHRLIPNFILQTGDPSATGTGGESIYGEPFPIESHSRLKFNRRGLLGMAANQDRTNESQFFLTLDATPELTGKHTLMGKVEGKSIYTLVELVEGVELVDGDRPRYPIKLHEVRVVENPFDDLQPRTTKKQRIAEERRKKHEMETRVAEEQKRKRSKAKKNTGLLSFGAEEEAEDEVALKGPKSSHDLLKDDKHLSRQTIETSKSTKANTPAVSANISSKEKRFLAQSSSSTTPPAVTKQASKDGTSDAPHPTATLKSEHSGPSDQKASSSTGRDFLASQRAKYLSSSHPSTAKQDDSYSALLSFQSRLRTRPSSTTPIAKPLPSVGVDEVEEEAGEYGASDDDDDWRSHRLDAGGQPLVAGQNAGKDTLEDYEVLDPRDHTDRERNPKAESSRDGKRGRDWVEHDRKYQNDRSRRHREHDKHPQQRRQRSII